MQNKPRRSHRLLAAAVALGSLAGPALAQSGVAGVRTSKPVSGKPIAANPAANSLNPAQARWAEVQVELALLAEDVLYPGQVSVHVHGMQLELTGMVPTETARQRAVQLARAHGTLPVKDGLKIHPADPSKASAEPAGALSTLATEVLKQNFKGKGPGCEVFSPAAGTLVVRGTATSFEEQLTVSRTLHDIPGCKAVVNEIIVLPVTFRGGQWQKVSRDGKLTVAATLPTDTPEGQPTGSAATTSTAGTKTEDKKGPAFQTVGYQPGTTPTTTPTAPPPSGTSGDYRVVPVQNGNMSYPSTTTTPYQTIQSQPQYQTQAQPQTQQRPMGGLFSRLFPGRSDAATTTQTYPSTTTAPPTGGRIVSQQTSPAPLPLPTTSATPGTTSTGPKPSSPGQAPGHQPYATSGVVIFEGQPGNPNTPTTPASPQDLKQRVQALTAGKARDVDVVTNRAGKVVIKFTAPSQAAEKELREKILLFPEAKTGNLMLEVIISP